MRARGAALARREHHRGLPLLGGEGGGIVGEDEPVPVDRVEEEVEDALFFEDPLHEVQLALPVLAEELARGVALPEAPLDARVDTSIREDLFHDLDRALPLEDAGAFAVLEGRERGPEPDPEAVLVSIAGEETYLVGQAIKVADAVLSVVDLEYHPVAKAVVDAKGRVAGGELNLDLVRE